MYLRLTFWFLSNDADWNPLVLCIIIINKASCYCSLINKPKKNNKTFINHKYKQNQQEKNPIKHNPLTTRENVQNSCILIIFCKSYSLIHKFYYQPISRSFLVQSSGTRRKTSSSNFEVRVVLERPRSWNWE
mgnify:CR=1 FL=1